MTKNRLFLAIMVMVATFFAISASTKEIVVHSSGGNQAHDQLYIEHPQVTFDEELCELSVYFGSTSTIDLECVDATGTPEATNDVLLGEGFIVENGATFAIKTPGKVTIDGCVFQSGAKVKIEAGNVEFVGKFTAELGSKVEFTQFGDD